MVIVKAYTKHEGEPTSDVGGKVASIDVFKADNSMLKRVGGAAVIGAAAFALAVPTITSVTDSLRGFSFMPSAYAASHLGASTVVGGTGITGAAPAPPAPSPPAPSPPAPTPPKAQNLIEAMYSGGTPTTIGTLDGGSVDVVFSDLDIHRNNINYDPSAAIKTGFIYMKEPDFMNFIGGKANVNYHNLGGGKVQVTYVDNSKQTLNSEHGYVQISLDTIGNRVDGSRPDNINLLKLLAQHAATNKPFIESLQKEAETDPTSLKKLTGLMGSVPNNMITPPEKSSASLELYCGFKKVKPPVCNKS